MTSPSQLSPSVFLHNGSINTDTTDVVEGPQLIVLATWMFARDANVNKYVAKYRELYPSAGILEIKYFLRYFARPQYAWDDLLPAVSMLRALSEQNPRTYEGKEVLRPPVIFHIFSNSGLSTFCNLCRLYAATSMSIDTTKSRLPLHAKIFDSTPGKYQYQSVTSAMMYGIPRGFWVYYMVACPLAHMFSAAVWIWIHLLGGTDLIPTWAEIANNPLYGLETCRSYAYSNADLLVQSDVVEKHAAYARDNGYTVLLLANFGSSAHVSHARADPVRYWTLVRHTWEGRLSI